MTNPGYLEPSPLELELLEKLEAIAESMLTLEAERLLLVYAYFTDSLVGSLAQRVIVGREMGLRESIDPKVNIIGSVLASFVGQIQGALHELSSPERVDQVATFTSDTFDTIDEILTLLVDNPEGQQRLMANLQLASQLIPDPMDVSQAELRQILLAGTGLEGDLAS